MALTGKQRAFVDQYFLCEFNGTEAAARAGYQGNRDSLAVTASENLRNPKVRAVIDGRLAERTMSADEVLMRLTDHGRGSAEDIISFRIERRYSTIPLPLGEVIQRLQATIDLEEAYAKRIGLTDKALKAHEDEMVVMRRRMIRLELQLEQNPGATEIGPGPLEEVHVPYIDLWKAAQRGKLHLVKSFNEKDGKAEFYDAQAAQIQLGKHHKLFTDKIEHGGVVTTVPITLEEWKAEAAKRRSKAEATMAAFEAEENDA